MTDDKVIWNKNHHAQHSDKEIELRRDGSEEWVFSIDDGYNSTFLEVDRNDLLELHKKLGEELGV